MILHDIKNTVVNGDCLDVLKRLPDNTFTACVTDPPAGISFMGKQWDSNKGGRDKWIEWLTLVMGEVLRVLKPGAHCLCWALPRTSHWTGAALEDAGFVVRDCVYYVTGQGFPKNHDISKAIDKAAGAEREVIAKVRSKGGGTEHLNRSNAKDHNYRPGEYQKGENVLDITAPATHAASLWDGWGTALKPAVECWWLCMKPLDGTFAQNALEHGVSGLNIDGCRVPTDEAITNHSRSAEAAKSKGKYGDSREQETHQTEGQKLGRFPANLIHDGSAEVLQHFPNTKSGFMKKGTRRQMSESVGKNVYGEWKPDTVATDTFGDEGSAARFFYCAKASRKERTDDGRVVNKHPTVKPLALMEYLCKLVQPPEGGLLLDPFAGSGTTGLAAQRLEYDFVLIEKDLGSARVAQERCRIPLVRFPRHTRRHSKPDEE